MFFTIPDITNTPIMLNIKEIESISIDDDMLITIRLGSGKEIQTLMPRAILVQMINKLSNKPETVITHTEFAG